jgi:hypothetical protein
MKIDVDFKLNDSVVERDYIRLIYVGELKLTLPEIEHPQLNEFQMTFYFDENKELLTYIIQDNKIFFWNEGDSDIEWPTAKSFKKNVLTSYKVLNGTEVAWFYITDKDGQLYFELSVFQWGKRLATEKKITKGVLLNGLNYKLLKNHFKKRLKEETNGAL